MIPFTEDKQEFWEGVRQVCALTYKRIRLAITQPVMHSRVREKTEVCIDCSVE